MVSLLTCVQIHHRHIPKPLWAAHRTNNKTSQREWDWEIDVKTSPTFVPTNWAPTFSPFVTTPAIIKTRIVNVIICQWFQILRQDRPMFELFSLYERLELLPAHEPMTILEASYFPSPLPSLPFPYPTLLGDDFLRLRFLTLPLHGVTWLKHLKLPPRGLADPFLSPLPKYKRIDRVNIHETRVSSNSRSIRLGIDDSQYKLRLHVRHDLRENVLKRSTRSASIFFDHCWRSSSLSMNSFHLPKPFTSMKLGESFELEPQQNCGWHAPLLPLAIGNLSFQRDHFLLEECDNVFFRQRTPNRIDSDNNSQLGTQQRPHGFLLFSLKRQTNWTAELNCPPHNKRRTTSTNLTPPWWFNMAICRGSLPWPFMVLSRGSFSWPSKRNARQRNVSKNKKIQLVKI